VSASRFRGCLPAVVALPLLLAALPAGPARAAEGPHTVRADVVLGYERAGDPRAVIEGSLTAESPDRMRLSTFLGFFKAFDLTSRADSFWVAVPRYGAVIAGRKSQVRVTPLDPGRLSQALFLDPLGARPDSADTTTDSTGTRIAGRDSLGSFELLLDRRDLPVRLERRRPSGEPFLGIDFERYGAVEGGRYPGRIRWRGLEGRQALAMELTNVRLDARAEQAGFGPPTDPDLEVIPWKSWEALFSARQR
jgi:hypothetical protein